MPTLPETTCPAPRALARRAVVILPSHAFAAHRIERMTLTGLRLTRVRPSAIVEARRALSLRSAAAPAARPALDATQERAPRQWPWTLATLALLGALVAACCAAAV